MKAKSLNNATGATQAIKIKITPGNALIQPGLISRMQNELADALSQDYAQQFVAAVRADMKVKRNEDAIKALKARIIGSGG